MRRISSVLVVLGLLTACGSEGRTSEPEAAASAPSTSVAAHSGDDAAFVRAVNAACKQYADADAALDFPEAADDYVPFIETFIANAARLDTQLERLDPPSTFEDFGGYVAKNREQTAVLRAAGPKIEAAVDEDDLAEADAIIDVMIDEFNAITDELDPYARRYGFDECTGGEE